MLQESLIYKCIYGIFLFLANSYENSMSARIIRRCGVVLKAGFSGSSIAGFVSRDGILIRTWDSSMAFKLTSGLISLPVKGLHHLYKKMEAVLTGSLLFKLFLLFLDRLHMLTAVFLAVILVIPHNYWDNRYSTAALVVLLLLYLARTAVEGKTGFYLKVFNVFLVLFLFCIVLSEVFSIMPKESLRFLAFYLTCFMLVLILMVSIRTREEMSETLAVILSGLMLSGLYGIYQYKSGVPVNPAWIDPNVNDGNMSRVYSSFGNPNNFAEIIVILLPFCAAAFFNAKGWFKKLFFLALAIPPFISLLFTLSRSGWIGLAVAVLIFTFFKEKRLIPVFILLGILAFPFMPQMIYRRILSITNPEDTSTLTRLQIYKSVLPILKDYWFSGLGLGNDTLVKVMRGYYMFTKGGTILPHSHNLYLQIWFETGIAGILSFIAFIGSVFKRCIKAIYNSGDRYVNNVLMAGISSLAGILVMGLAEYVWFYPRVMLLFWAVIGIILAALSMLVREAGEEKKAAV